VPDPSAPSGATEFSLDPRPGGAADGWTSGFDRRRLRQLRRGGIAPELELDLHGLTREEARRALRRTLRDALARGLRCVLVVHGRGARSSADTGPVLRDALPGWLAEPPHGASVLAFAAAEDRRGGATYVLLRRARGHGVS
jgi:DNA-nicking Smr family endonuclease